MSFKKIKLILTGSIIAIGIIIYLLTIIIEKPLLGLSVTSGLISIILLFYSGTSLDRRFKTGYKNNNSGIPFKLRLKKFGFGAVISIILYLCYIYNSSEEPSENIRYTIKPTKGLNLRKDSLKKNSNIILIIPHGDTINSNNHPEKENWIKISYKDNNGWVYKKYLVPIK